MPVTVDSEGDFVGKGFYNVLITIIGLRLNCSICQSLREETLKETINLLYNIKLWKFKKNFYLKVSIESTICVGSNCTYFLVHSYPT